MGSFDYSDDYSSFDNLLDRTTLLTEGGAGLRGYHPGFGPLRTKIEDVGGIGTYRARQFVVSLLYRYIKPPIITEEELDYIETQDGRTRGAASKEYNAALTEVLDKHKDEIAQRADEIGDALEENFPEMANKILGVNPEKARMKIATRAAEQEVKTASKKIKQGKDPEKAVDDAVENIMSGPTMVQIAINKVLNNIQTELGEPGFDISEDALQQAIDYVDRIETVDQLEEFVKQTLPLPEYKKIAMYLDGAAVKPLRKYEKEQLAKSEDDEDPYAGVNDPGDPEDEEYSKNLEGGRTSIVDSLNNDMRKKKLLFEKKKNWMKGAVKKPGALNAAAKSAGESKSEYCASPPSGKAEKRCNLWKTFNKYRPEDEEGGNLDAAQDEMIQLAQSGENPHTVLPGVARKHGVDPSVLKQAIFGKENEEDEKVHGDPQRGPMLDSYQTDTSNYLSEQTSKDKRNKKPEVKNQSFRERYKPKTHWQLQELRRMGL